MFIPIAAIVVAFLLAPELTLGLGLIVLAVVFWPVTLCIAGLWLLAVMFGGEK